MDIETYGLEELKDQLENFIRSVAAEGNNHSYMFDDDNFSELGGFIAEYKDRIQSIGNLINRLEKKIDQRGL